MGQHTHTHTHTHTHILGILILTVASHTNTSEHTTQQSSWTTTLTTFPGLDPDWKYHDVTAPSVQAEFLISYLDPNLPIIPSDYGHLISCCVWSYLPPARVVRSIEAEGEEQSWCGSGAHGRNYYWQNYLFSFAFDRYEEQNVLITQMLFCDIVNLLILENILMKRSCVAIVRLDCGTLWKTCMMGTQH